MKSNQVITLARSYLNLMDTEENNNYLEKLINIAAGRLNATDSYVINCKESEIECGQAALPEFVDELICFQLEPSNSCSGCCQGMILSTTEAETGTLPAACNCVSYYYFSQAAMTGAPGSCGWYQNYFYMQDNYLHFPSTVTATSVKIWYRGLNVDDNGIMILQEEQEDALASFAAYRYALTFPQSYSPLQINEFKQNWIAQKNWLNGTEAVRKFKLQKPQISAVMNSIMMNKFVPGYGR